MLTSQLGDQRRRKDGTVAHHLVQFSSGLERPLQIAFGRKYFLMVTRLGGFGGESGKLALIE